MCSICRNYIPITSNSCPECGDPEPFAIPENGTEKAQILQARKIEIEQKADPVNDKLEKDQKRTGELIVQSPLQILFSSKGRISRKQFWIYMIPMQSVGLALQFYIEFQKIIFQDAWEKGYVVGYSTPEIVVISLLAILFIVVVLNISIKRIHDRGKSVGWLFIGLVPIIGFIYLFIELGCLLGTIGPNRYGEDPLERNVLSIKGKMDGNFEASGEFKDRKLLTNSKANLGWSAKCNNSDQSEQNPSNLVTAMGIIFSVFMLGIAYMLIF